MAQSTFIFKDLNLEDLQSIACKLSLSIKSPVVILLDGDLGAGKTTFSRFFIRNLLSDSSLEIPSPTFTLIQAYEKEPLLIWHVDLYRLKSPEEIFELGLLEAFGKATCLIEWPERLGNYKPKSFIDVKIGIQGNGKRSLNIDFQGICADEFKP